MTAALGEGMLTIDELSSATGLSVRTTRYYASLGLIPPPVRRGRIAFYAAEHRARLELVVALQEHGFTLQAIERYLSRLPDDVTPEDLAMQRSMITSWTSSERPDEAYVRIGRELRALGLSGDALNAAQEIAERHLGHLAAEYAELFRDEVVEPWRRTQHTAEEAERLTAALPRLRELTLEVVVVAFQQAVDRTIGRGLAIDDE